MTLLNKVWFSWLEQCSEGQGCGSNPPLADCLAYVPQSSLNLYQPFGRCEQLVTGWNRENVKPIPPLAAMMSFTPGFSPDS